MAFKYKFAQLLNLAIHEENEVKNRLALKDGQIAQIEMELKKNREAYEQALEAKASDLLAGRMDRVKLFFAYFTRLEKAKEYFLDEKERLMAQREKILQELIEKRRIRKIYEKLRERHEAKYRKQEQKRDQKIMDEFAKRTGVVKLEENP